MKITAMIPAPQDMGAVIADKEGQIGVRPLIALVSVYDPNQEESDIHGIVLGPVRPEDAETIDGFVGYSKVGQLVSRAILERAREWARRQRAA